MAAFPICDLSLRVCNRAQSPGGMAVENDLSILLVSDLAGAQTIMGSMSGDDIIIAQCEGAETGYSFERRKVVLVRG